MTAARQGTWDRLDELAAKRKLTGSEIDELVALYRSTSRDLMQLRSAGGDPLLVTALSRRIAAARARLSEDRQSVRGLRSFMMRDIPAALYRLMPWSIGVTVACLLVMVAVGVWVAHTPEALAELGTPSARARYATQSFRDYYSTYANSEFAALVWTNNARIAVLCLAGGITGLLPASILFQNSVGIGESSAMMAEHGLLGEFFAYILPHGLLELQCVFVAGAAGLKLFWTLLVPGNRPRLQALAEEGRALITTAIALTIGLAVSGLIEGFVTPNDLPVALKLAIGILAWAAWWLITIALGRPAVLSGADGDLAAEDAGYRPAVAGVRG